MTTASDALLGDASLAPFLAPTFSTAAHLNTVLPSVSSVPLGDLSTQTSTLLSTLDYQTQRLLAVLNTLTDEILRLSPRLAYSVDLLRSDVVSLGEELQGVVAVDRPPGLERLEMLSTVRERVEEVVGVFGEAMEWSIGEGEEAKKGARDPVGEVAYLLASGDLKRAREKVDALRVLASVFQGTVEGPARVAVVDKLDAKVGAAERAQEEKLAGGKSDERPKKSAEPKKEESGYYGLIEQLKGLRGMT